MSLARRSWEQSIIDDGNRRLPIGANICDRSIDHTFTPGQLDCNPVERFAILRWSEPFSPGRRKSTKLKGYNCE